MRREVYGEKGQGWEAYFHYDFIFKAWICIALIKF